MALSPGDPNSYARPDQVSDCLDQKNFVTVLISITSGLNVQVVTKHIHLELEVDFHARVLHGHVLLSVERVDPAASTLLLDVSRLQIDSVQVDICCPSSPVVHLSNFLSSGREVWF